jgi:AraC-like DNA-binding protein
LVAQEHNVSVRQLNRVMGVNGIKLAAWIRGQRLERIRRDLADPSLAGRSAERIAADWGILDASHLSRAMRAEFGQNASQIRRTAISKRDAQDIVTEAQTSRG